MDRIAQTMFDLSLGRDAATVYLALRESGASHLVALARAEAIDAVIRAQEGR